MSPGGAGLRPVEARPPTPLRDLDVPPRAVARRHEPQRRLGGEGGNDQQARDGHSVVVKDVGEGARVGVDAGHNSTPAVRGEKGGRGGCEGMNRRTSDSKHTRQGTPPVAQEPSDTRTPTAMVSIAAQGAGIAAVPVTRPRGRKQSLLPLQSGATDGHPRWQTHDHPAVHSRGAYDTTRARSPPPQQKHNPLKRTVPPTSTARRRPRPTAPPQPAPPRRRARPNPAQDYIFLN